MSGAKEGWRRRGSCSSPFMNSQAPISSPDSAAILSEIRTGEGGSWPAEVTRPRGLPHCPGAGELAVQNTELDSERQQAPKAEAAGGSERRAPRGHSVGNSSPLRAGRTRPGLWPLGFRPGCCWCSAAWETQTSSHGRAQSSPGSQSDHGGADVWPQSRPWLLVRQQAGLWCPPAGSSCSGSSFATSFQQQLFLLLLPLGPPPDLSPRPPSAPSTFTAPRPSLKGTAPLLSQCGPLALPGAARVAKSRLLRLCCGPPIAVQEAGPSGRKSRAGPPDKLMNETMEWGMDRLQGAAATSEDVPASLPFLQPLQIFHLCLPFSRSRPTHPRSSNLLHTRTDTHI